jgi:hypothetical protein
VLQNSKTVQKMLETVVDRGRLQRLFTEADRPIVALRIRHPAWFVPHGQLASFSIPAAQKMTRRAFDSLYYPNLVAVGLFKAFTSPTDYLVELHQIVAGAEKSGLERVFFDAWADEVESVQNAIENMLNGRPETHVASGKWKTIRPHSEEVKLNSEQWPEYIGWLKAHFHSLVFRYGCDRYWNRLRKEPRLLKSKVKKPHPYPYWLEPYWFDGPYWDNKNIDRSRPKRAPDTGMDYFNLEDDDE